MEAQWPLFDAEMCWWILSKKDIKASQKSAEYRWGERESGGFKILFITEKRVREFLSPELINLA